MPSALLENCQWAPDEERRLGKTRFCASEAEYVLAHPTSVDRAGIPPFQRDEMNAPVAREAMRTKLGVAGLES